MLFLFPLCLWLDSSSMSPQDWKMAAPPLPSRQGSTQKEWRGKRAKGVCKYAFKESSEKSGIMTSTYISLVRRMSLACKGGWEFPSNQETLPITATTGVLMVRDKGIGYLMGNKVSATGFLPCDWWTAFVDWLSYTENISVYKILIQLAVFFNLCKPRD